MSVPDFIQNHRQVVSVNEEDTQIRVKPFGNCSLFGNIHRSDRINLGNVATYENDDLRLNYDLLG